MCFLREQIDAQHARQRDADESLGENFLDSRKAVIYLSGNIVGTPKGS